MTEDGKGVARMSTFVMNESDGHLTVSKASLSLFRLAMPTAVSFCASTLSNTAAYAFIGSHTDELTQAAHALGYSIGNILVLMVGLGLINGMDTLCPLAIGSGHPEYTFAYLIQAFSIVTAAMIPLIPFVFFTENLLILCKQDPDISAGAGLYLKYSFPGLFFICVFETLRKFLIYHQHILTQLIVSLLSIPIQVFFLWIFVGLFSWGVIGAGIARSITWLTLSLALLILTFLKREDFAWSKYFYPKHDEGTNAREISEGQIDAELQQQTEVNDGDDAGPRCTTTTTEGDEAQLTDDRNNSGDDTKVPSSKDTVTVTPTDELNDNDKFDGDSTKEEEQQQLNDTNALEYSPSLVQESIQIDKVLPLSISALSMSTSAMSPKQQPPIHEHWWEGLGEFLRIAIPSTFLCIFEWLSFEIQVIEAGYLGPTELAALSASQSLGGLIYFISLSVGIIVNSQVGRCMGRLSPLDGKTVTKAGILASVYISVPVAIVVSLCRTQIATLFSSSLAIREILSKNLLCLALGVVWADSLHGIITGAIKALSLQWTGAVFDLFGLLGIMQAIGLVLAFRTKLKGQGFVIGTAVGLLCVDICYFILLFVGINWTKRAKYLSKQRRKTKPSLSNA